MENQKSKFKNTNNNSENIKNKVSNRKKNNLESSVVDYVSGDSTPSSSGHKFKDNIKHNN